MAQSGDNLTGLEIRHVELMGKGLELLKVAVPRIACVAIYVDKILKGAQPADLPAQQAGKMPGLGILRGGRADGQFVQDFLEAFRQWLREFGWVEG